MSACCCVDKIVAEELSLVNNFQKDAESSNSPVERKYRMKEYEAQEPLIIKVADALVDPNAMVVHTQHTLIAN